MKLLFEFISSLVNSSIILIIVTSKGSEGDDVWARLYHSDKDEIIYGEVIQMDDLVESNIILFTGQLSVLNDLHTRLTQHDSCKCVIKDSQDGPFTILSPIPGDVIRRKDDYGNHIDEYGLPVSIPTLIRVEIGELYPLGVVFNDKTIRLSVSIYEILQCVRYVRTHQSLSVVCRKYPFSATFRHGNIHGAAVSSYTGPEEATMNGKNEVLLIISFDQMNF